jgi:hypothetical protein
MSSTKLSHQQAGCVWMPTLVGLAPGHNVPAPGAGTVIAGLSPALSISVAPSGIAPPMRGDAFAPGTDSGEAAPLDTFGNVGGQLDSKAVAADPLNPPPSNVELAATLAAAAAQSALGTGLNPPGSISVAPSGMPLAAGPFDPGMPSGDVALMPDAPVALWA